MRKTKFSISPNKSLLVALYWQ